MTWSRAQRTAHTTLHTPNISLSGTFLKTGSVLHHFYDLGIDNKDNHLDIVNFSISAHWVQDDVMKLQERLSHFTSCDLEHQKSSYKGHIPLPKGI